ncbi:hypothetical protein EPIB1_296 [Tritonibacter mobilis]|nr:hypothetical protein EPIB1_296 [Tritonibacter mobilis]
MDSCVSLQQGRNRHKLPGARRCLRSGLRHVFTPPISGPPRPD